MVPGIVSSPVIANIAQNTSASVSVETVLKSIGRPGFILIDKDIDGKTKQYAAAKEFLYQMTCLAIYMALITPVFKAGAFALGKKFYNGAHGFDKFKNASEYLNYHDLASRSIKKRKSKLTDPDFAHKKSLLNHDGLVKDLYSKEKPDKYPKIKGTIELGSLVGSVLGLAIIAPQIGHHIIHPVLGALGLEEKDKAENRQKLDKKA